jgi:hypothetical protein
MGFSTALRNRLSLLLWVFALGQKIQGFFLASLVRMTRVKVSWGCAGRMKRREE